MRADPLGCTRSRTGRRALSGRHDPAATPLGAGGGDPPAACHPRAATSAVTFPCGAAGPSRSARPTRPAPRGSRPGPGRPTSLIEAATGTASGARTHPSTAARTTVAVTQTARRDFGTRPGFQRVTPTQSLSSAASRRPETHRSHRRHAALSCQAHAQCLAGVPGIAEKTRPRNEARTVRDCPQPERGDSCYGVCGWSIRALPWARRVSWPRQASSLARSRTRGNRENVCRSHGRARARCLCSVCLPRFNTRRSDGGVTLSAVPLLR